MVRFFKSDFLHALDAFKDALHRERVKRFSEFGLTEWDANILLAVRHVYRTQTQRRITASDVSYLTGASLSYISRAVSRLSNRGILTQTIIPDDRRYRYIAPTGKIDLDALAAVDEDIEARILAKITPEEQKTLIDILEKVNDF